MEIANPFKGLPKPAIYASLIGFTGITGYLAWKHHASTGSWNPWSSGSSSSATTSTTTIDPVTGMPSSQDDATDPVTGLTYLAEAQQYGSVAAAEADVSQFGQSTASGSGVGVSPATYPVAGSPAGTQTGNPYTSNAAWSQAVQAGLTDIGYSAIEVASALGLYLTGQPLTPAQAKIVNTAIGEYGPAPVGNLQVILAPAQGPATTATVPKVTGLSVADAVSAIRAAGLVPGAHSDETGTVNGQTPGPGKVVALNSKVDLSVAGTSPAPAAAEVTVPDVTGQKAGAAHNALVRAGLTVGNRPNSNWTVTATTPAAGSKVPKGRSVDITAKP
jgi:hypothetical protein